MRADKFFATRYGSRTKSAEAIERGWVLVNGKTIRPKDEVSETDIITFAETGDKFVSMGGYKLARALSEFHVDVSDKIWVDLGASTGGFTDCLLQNGAKRVYAVDVGESLLDERLQGDNRVIVMDNTNARYLTRQAFDEPIDGVVADVSFISLRLIFPVIAEILDENGYAVTLIKPQFECDGKTMGKSGIVRPSLHREIVKKVLDYAEMAGLFPVDIVNAPVRKGKNVEYVVYLSKRKEKAAPLWQLINTVAELVQKYKQDTLQ